MLLYRRNQFILVLLSDYLREVVFWQYFFKVTQIQVNKEVLDALKFILKQKENWNLYYLWNLEWHILIFNPSKDLVY